MRKIVGYDITAEDGSVYWAGTRWNAELRKQELERKGLKATITKSK